MKKYFSFLIIVVLSIFLVSCGEPSSEVSDKLSEKYIVKMAKTDLEKHLYNNEEYESFLMNVQEFSHLFSEAVYESYKEDENFRWWNKEHEEIFIDFCEGRNLKGSTRRTYKYSLNKYAKFNGTSSKNAKRNYQKERRN